MTHIGAGFVKGERKGNQISPKGSNQGRSTGVAELSSHEDIEERNLVAELGQGKIRPKKPDEELAHINLDSLAHRDFIDKLFTKEEIEEMRKMEETIEGEAKPQDIDDVWDGIRNDVKRHNKEVAKKRREQERQRIKEAFKDPALEKKMTQMTGEEIQRVINNESTSQVDKEELEAALDKVDEKYASWLDEDSNKDFNPVQADELSEGLNAFREFSENEGSDAWGDIAEDIEKSSEVPDTEVTTLSDGSKLIKTSYDKLKAELGEMDHRSDKDTEIVDKKGEIITAKVPEGESYD